MTDAEREAMLAPLIAICRWKELRWGWRTYWTDEGWRAEIHAGDRVRRGAHPCWVGKADTERGALTIAIAYAAGYWDDHEPGISPTLRDLVALGRNSGHKKSARE